MSYPCAKGKVKRTMQPPTRGTLFAYPEAPLAPGGPSAEGPVDQFAMRNACIGSRNKGGVGGHPSDPLFIAVRPTSPIRESFNYLGGLTIVIYWGVTCAAPLATDTSYGGTPTGRLVSGHEDAEAEAIRPASLGILPVGSPGLCAQEQQEPRPARMLRSRIWCSQQQSEYSIYIAPHPAPPPSCRCAKLYPP
jgi:hypothetical protein